MFEKWARKILAKELSRLEARANFAYQLGDKIASIQDVIVNRRAEVGVQNLVAATNALIDKIEAREQEINLAANLLSEVVYKSIKQPEWEDNIPYPIEPTLLINIQSFLKSIRPIWR